MLKPIYLWLAGGVGLVAWLLWRNSGGASRADVPSGFYGLDDGGAGGGGGGGFAAPAVVPPEVIATKIGGAGPDTIDRGFSGDASPFVDRGGGAGLASIALPKEIVSPPVIDRAPVTDYFKRAAAPEPLPTPTPPPAPPLSDTVPRAAISAAKAAAAAPRISELPAGRLDVSSLGSGGLFSNLVTMPRRSPAITTPPAGAPRAVTSAKGGSKSSFG